MSVDRYLNAIIDKYRVNIYKENYKPIQDVFLILKSWAGETLESINVVGSHSKGTSISTSNDIDILLKLDSKTCFDLKNLYLNLFEYLNHKRYYPFQKEISIGVIYNKNSFDVFPAIKSPTGSNHVRIYDKLNENCIETNIITHLDYIKSSNLIKQIVLTKIWRDINKLHFPTFYLELCVLEILHHQKKDSLEKNFLFILDFLSDDFINTSITDPVNPGNIISDRLSYQEKMDIAQCARITRKKASWEEIIW